MKGYSYFLIGLALIVSVFYYIATSLSFIKEEFPQHYTLLIRPPIVETNGSVAAGNNPAKPTTEQWRHMYVVFYWYPESYFLIFTIPTHLHIKENNTWVSLQNNSDFEIKKRLKNVYGFSIDFIANYTKADIKALLQFFGGTQFFNLYSNAMPKGEIFLEEKIYQKFIAGITDPFNKEDVKKGIWLTLLENYRSKSISEIAFKDTKKMLFKKLNLDMNYGTYKKLTDPLLNTTKNKEIFEEVFVKAIRANLSEINDNLNGPIDVPYQNGRYDSRLIRETLANYKNNLPRAQLFPIVMQLFNTTDISRLAVRTAGVLRIRRIDVLEYLNSSTQLQRSVLLNYAHSPLKTHYVKRHTRISTVYKMFNYRENFDFTLYLGNDYYGIKFLQQQRDALKESN